MRFFSILALVVLTTGCFETVEADCARDEDCFRGESCVGGACVELTCPEGQEICGGTCFDTQTSRQHCGECGVTCEVACFEGSCLEPTQLSVGGRHACAVVGAQNRVACWGANDFGQLGRDGRASSEPVVVEDLRDVRSVSAGLNFTCALRQSGVVDCWGSNSAGQLGRSVPGAGEGQFSPVVSPVENLSGVVDVAAGERHACATIGDEMLCWGSNRVGALGVADVADFRTDASAIDYDRSAGETFGTVSSGRDFSCALNDDARLICWGANDSGQSLLEINAGPETPATRGLQMSEVSLGGGVACGVLVEGNSVCWGRNTSGELGRDAAAAAGEPAELANAASLRDFALGMGEHVCALDIDQKVWCWGKNSSKEAAPNSDTDILRAPVDTGLVAEELGVGIAFSCARNQRTITCWGDDSDGRLGPFGITNERIRPPRQE